MVMNVVCVLAVLLITVYKQTNKQGPRQIAISCPVHFNRCGWIRTERNPKEQASGESSRIEERQDLAALKQLTCMFDSRQ